MLYQSPLLVLFFLGGLESFRGMDVKSNQVTLIMYNVIRQSGWHHRNQLFLATSPAMTKSHNTISHNNYTFTVRRPGVHLDHHRIDR